jgi:predicted ATPase/DNA-binding CsgD family transcriptional regulator
MVPVTDLGATQISAREAQVLTALGEHLTNAEIAQRLHISVRTVESHVSALLRKLGAVDRRDLAGMAATPSPHPLAAVGPPPVPEMVGLPVNWTSFVGRSAELTALTQALSESRLITLVGPGGVGKTRLATEAATRAASLFPGGGAFIDLVAVTSEFVVAAVAASLGVVERPQIPLEQVVLERLRGDRTLLVLDNCEHVLDAAFAFTRSVLGTCPDTVLLVTSRERLDLPGERVMTVPPLAVAARYDEGGSDATRLFTERAGAVDSNPELVNEICRRLEGMPLAIELAAARSSSLGIDGLLAGLDDHLRLLSRTSKAVDRHGSLRNVIDWSHQLLDDTERTAFRRLGIFVGTFDLVAAAMVAADGDRAAASDVIGRLTDKSLLVHVPHPTGSRWRMLETVHAYAHEHLEASGEADEIRGRHHRWAAAAAGELVQSLDAGDGEKWQEQFDLIAGDLRAALTAPPAVSTDDADFRLAVALSRLTYGRRFMLESRDHFQTAVARAPDAASAIDVLRLAAGAAFAELRGEAAFDLLQAALARASEIGDQRTAAIVVADAAALAGRHPAAFASPLTHEQLVALIDQASALAPAGDLEVDAHIAVASAWDGALGSTVVTPERSGRAVELARRLDDPILISAALDAAASAASDAGHYKEASRRSAERLRLLDRLPRYDPRTGGEIVDIFHMASESAVGAGELEAALAHARRAVEDVTHQGLPHFAAAHLMAPLVLRGDFDEALDRTAVIRDGWERSGRPAAGWLAPPFFAAAFAYLVRGDEEAYQKWRELGTAMQVGRGADCCRIYFTQRGALHVGALEHALASITDLPVTSVSYDSYAAAVTVEIAVVTGAPDAGEQLAEAQRHLAAENDFVAAQLLRAAGRLHGDETVLKSAIIGWEAIGARFERACTLLLLSDRVEEGLAELAALGCTPPAPSWSGLF